MIIVLQVIGAVSMIIFGAIGFITVGSGPIGAAVSVNWFVASLLGLIAMGIGSVCERVNELMEQNQFYRDNPVPGDKESKSRGDS